MSALQPITIVGGGLAGLTLGIGLRRQQIPVTIQEAGEYPRHRVCGEFISGHGPAILEQLELQSLLDKAGAFHARTAVFICGTRRSPVRSLPSPALCLSRYVLDALLADEFQRMGGELRTRTRATTAESAEGTVWATGRRAQATEGGWRWFGLKTHVRNLRIAADLEMHVSPAGYVGVNRINGDEVNVCGLFRAGPGADPGAAKREWLKGKPGSPLHERLADAEFDEDAFCSVAGLSLQPHRADDRRECCIGDAVTMIPPVTGNGMSMAFESAAIAIAPLVDYSRGKTAWAEAQQTIARKCDAAFSRRLAWARWLQRLMFSPLLRSPLGSVILGSDRLWQWMFNRTR